MARGGIDDTGAVHRRDQWPTGTVTFLFTSVEDVPRHGGEAATSPDSGPSGLVAILDVVAEEHDGVRLVVGDETGAPTHHHVLAFGRALDAVRAALDTQQAIEHGTEQADEPLSIHAIRLAVHTGDVHADDGRYTGPAVHQGERIAAAVHGGQLVVSRTTHDLVADGADDRLLLSPLGSHRLPGVARPIELFQVDRGTTPTPFPSLRTLDGTPNNLPRSLTSFVGRAEARAEIGALVGNHRLTTLTGSGGCGKTRLAVEVAGDVIDRFDDGAWFVDLAPITDPDDVATALADVLQLRLSPGLSVVDHVIARLRREQALIVLDNCEHLLDGSGALVDALLTRTDHVRVLVTSREPLGLAGELTWRIPSLSLPTADADPSAVLATEAGALFLARADLARAEGGRHLDDTTIDDGTASAIGAICRRLDGIPLAIELAAARLRFRTVDEVRDELDDRFRVLTGGGRNVLPRQRTLEASVAWSHDLLTPTEQTVLRRCAVFAGGFRPDDAVAVLAEDDGLDAATVAEVVTRLVDKSLLSASGSSAPTRRLVMLETVRQFAAQRLLEHGETERLRDRHLAHVHRWAHTMQAPLRDERTVESLAAVDAEQDNVRAALAWADATADGPRMIQILDCTWPWWELRGHRRDLDQWLRRLATHEATLDDTGRARMLLCDINNHYGLESGDEEQGRALALREELTDLDDERSAAELDAVIAGNTWWSGRPMDGPPLLAAAAARCEAAGDEYMAWWCRIGETIGPLFVSRIDLALPRMRELEPGVRAFGSPVLLASLLGLRAQAEAIAGNLAAARRIGAESAERRAPITSTGEAIVPIAAATMADLAQGRPSTRRRLLRQLVDRYTAEGSLLFVPWLCDLLTRIDVAEGRPEVALRVVDGVLSHPEAVAVAFYRVHLRETRALATWLLGDLDAARAELEDLRTDAAEVGNLRSSALADLHLAGLDREQGDHLQAAERVHRAMATFEEMGLALDVAACLDELTGLALDADRPVHAARLSGASAAIRRPEGACFRLGRQPVLDADVARGRAALGDEEWDREHQAGAELSLADAIAFATRTRGERARPTVGWDSLTPTERRVADLAADGLTNAAIAGQLLMSAETVKSHLSHTYRKLGIANRTQLAAELARRVDA